VLLANILTSVERLNHGKSIGFCKDADLLRCTLTAHLFQITQTEQVLSNETYENNYFCDQGGAEKIAEHDLSMPLASVKHKTLSLTEAALYTTRTKVRGSSVQNRTPRIYIRTAQRL
jgi:hypothetical protein